MRLVSAEEILAFLPNETNSPATQNKINACEDLAQAQAESYAMISFADYTPKTVPADIKTAVIKWTLAEYVANEANSNYIDGDGNFVDRASRHRKEAHELLDRYRPTVAI